MLTPISHFNKFAKPIPESSDLSLNLVTPLICERFEMFRTQFEPNFFSGAFHLIITCPPPFGFGQISRKQVTQKKKRLKKPRLVVSRHLADHTFPRSQRRSYLIRLSLVSDKRMKRMDNMKFCEFRPRCGLSLSVGQPRENRQEVIFSYNVVLITPGSQPRSRDLAGMKLLVVQITKPIFLPPWKRKYLGRGIW